MNHSATISGAAPDIVRSRYFTMRFASWLKRHFARTTLWSATLLTLAWQYENWHGQRALEKQRRLWVAEYGEMKWEDLTPARVPDEENFFAAPVFETFVASNTPGFSEYSPDAKAHQAALAMPHARFLHMQAPKLKMCDGIVPESTTAPGLKTLDISAWANEQQKGGKSPTTGTSDAAWLHASMPDDATVRGLVEALSRPQSAILPQAADRMALVRNLKDPGAIPLLSFSGCWDLCKHLTLRARAAARAGDGASARNLTEVISRLQEGISKSTSLSGHICGSAIEVFLLDAVAEGLATKCWNDADLQILAARLDRVDEEKSLLAALTNESFCVHMLPVEDVSARVRRDLGGRSNWDWEKFRKDPDRLMLWLATSGPVGWYSANLAQHLRLWQRLLMPDGSGDDLRTLSGKMSIGIQEIETESKGMKSPRDIVSRHLLPNLGDMPKRAMEHQTRRRQLLMAIAAERFALAHGQYPATAEAMVPDLLAEIPNDPYQPGTPLRYETGTAGERYRLISVGKDSVLAMPMQL